MGAEGLDNCLITVALEALDDDLYIQMCKYKIYAIHVMCVCICALEWKGWVYQNC